MDGKKVWILVLALALAGTAFYAYRVTHDQGSFQQSSASPTSTAPAPSGSPVTPTQPMTTRNANEQNERLQALNDRAKDLETRLNQAQKDADRARVSDLEKQLADVKNELATTKAAAAAELAAADRQLARAQAQAANPKFKRVEFEVSTSRPAEVAPGISVDIIRTNALDQRFSGRVLFVPEGRTITLREQSANSPVVFFARNGADRYELVIKTVKDNSVSGYVLLPASG